MTKKIIVNKFDIILIRWEDACSNSMWRDEDTFEPPWYPVTTVGFFLGASEDYWVVATNHAWRHGQVDTMSVPVGMIKDVEVLRRAKV